MLNIENLYVKGFEMEYLINYKYQNVLYPSPISRDKDHLSIAVNVVALTHQPSLVRSQ
jgi:hypothetical protein